MLDRLVESYDLDFEWMGFQLHPRTPRGGMKVSELFGGRDMSAAHEQLRGFAQSFGVEIRLSDRLPNTRRPLAMAEFARDQGRLHPFRDAVMDAHWSEGRDIEDGAVLREMAEKAGLNADEALAAADGPLMNARVDALGEEARRWGVTGIPTWFLLPEGWTPGAPLAPSGPRPVRIVGCQPYERVLAGCMQAGVQRRSSDLN